MGASEDRPEADAVCRTPYVHWLEEAEINPTRRRLYMGHVAKDPHELYPEHDVTPHLEPDAKILQGYLGFEAPGLKVVA